MCWKRWWHLWHLNKRSWNPMSPHMQHSLLPLCFLVLFLELHFISVCSWSIDELQRLFSIIECLPNVLPNPTIILIVLSLEIENRTWTRSLKSPDFQSKFPTFIWWLGRPWIPFSKRCPSSKLRSWMYVAVPHVSEKWSRFHATCLTWRRTELSCYMRVKRGRQLITLEMKIAQKRQLLAVAQI